MASIHEPSAAAWSRLDRLVSRFEDAWQRGDKPRLDEFLDDGATVQRAVLGELVLLDLQYRLKNGEAARVEDYLGRYPELAEETELILSLLASEYELRKRTEPELAVAEYERRFPQLGKDLARRLQAPPELAFLRPLPHFLPAATPPNGAPQVPGYEIVGELGHGGMGVVYKAVQVGLQRFVALKMIREGVHTDVRELARFRSEAVKLARLQHPHIVQIHEVGEKEGKPYFSMELVEGGSLTTRLGGTPLPPERAAEMLQTLARAIHYAHQRDLVHRDLKPDNVLLTLDGTPKVTDFGLSRILDSADLGGSYGTIIGTPSYMSPEQARGQVERIGPAADVYALGAILYELLTGRPPFRAATVLDTLDQVRNQKPVPLRQLQPKVPRDLETICLKCLQKDPADRYLTAEQLAEDLRRFLNHEPIKARPTPPWEFVWKWARRRPGLAALAAVSTAALIALGTLLLWNAAEARTQAAQERQRLTDLRGEVQGLVMQAQTAFAASDWYTSARLADVALARAGSEPPLADLIVQAEQMKAESTRKEQEEQNRKRAQTRLQQFNQLRDEALFHASLFTGLDQATNQQATQKAAGAALALFGEPRQDGSDLAVEPALTPDQQGAIRTGCYELLLALAEAVPAAERLPILDRAEKLVPQSPALALRRARYLEQIGDRAAAQKEQARAAKMRPINALDHFLLGVDHSIRGAGAEAILHFQEALYLQPNHFWAQYFWAIANLRQQQFTEAKTRLDACLFSQPESIPAAMMRGYANTQIGIAAATALDYGTADRSFIAAARDFAATLNGLKRDPNPKMEYELYVFRGDLRRNDGQLLLKQADLLEQNQQLTLARAARQRGLDLLTQAEADLYQAIGLDANQSTAYTYLALIYRDQKQWDAAADQYREAIERQPKNAWLYRTRADVFWESNRLPEAMQDIETAIQLEPGNPAFWMEKGRILARQGQPEAALDAYAAALEREPNHAAVHNQRGEVLLKLRRYAEAERAFDRCLALGLATPEVYALRGAARFQHGKAMPLEKSEERLRCFLGAVDDYTSAEKFRPGLDADQLTRRGWALIQCQAWTLAQRDAEKALELQSGNLEALTLRAYAQVRQGPQQIGQAVAEAADLLRRLVPLPDAQTMPGPFLMQSNPLGLAACAAALVPDARVQEMLHNVACTFALAASHLEGEAAARCRRQAVTALRQALEALPPAQRQPHWQEKIRPDPDLQPLQDSAEFRELEKIFVRSDPDSQ